MFMSFLCMSEFTWSQLNKTSDFKQWHLIRNSIIFQNNFLQFILLSFKINSFKCEITLIIIVINDEVCIKNSLINLFSKFSAFLLMSLFDSEYSYMQTHVIKILHRMLVTVRIVSKWYNQWRSELIVLNL